LFLIDWEFVFGIKEWPSFSCSESRSLKEVRKKSLLTTTPSVVDIFNIEYCSFVMSQDNNTNNIEENMEEKMLNILRQQEEMIQISGSPVSSEESLKFYDEYISHSSTLFGPDCQIVAIAQCLKADFLVSTGEWKVAFDVYLSALRVTMISFGDNHIRTALVLEKIGNVCLQTQDHDSALNAFKEAVAKFRLILPITDPKIIACINNIARSHCLHGTGQSLRKALEVYQHCLSIQRSSFARDLLMEATTLSAIGQINGRLEFDDAAIECHKEAMILRTRVLGDNHFDISTSLFAIATIQFNRENYELALVAFKHCLSIRISNPCNVEDVSSVLFNIAAVCAENGNPAQAIDFFKEAINVESASDLNKNNKTILQCLHHITQVHQSQGQFNGAIETALQACQLALSDKNISLSYKLEVLRLTGNLYLENGNAGKAHEYFTIARELGCKNGPPTGAKPLSARAA
jgi:tetratricopeptide (TPR) repeat protein